MENSCLPTEILPPIRTQKRFVLRVWEKPDPVVFGALTKNDCFPLPLKVCYPEEKRSKLVRVFKPLVAFSILLIPGLYSMCTL